MKPPLGKSFIVLSKSNILSDALKGLVKFSNNATFKRIILIHTYCTVSMSVRKPITWSPHFSFAFCLSAGA